MPLTSKKIVHLAAKAAQSKKAEEIIILEVGKISLISDYFLICSGNSDTQVKAIADAVVEKLKKEGTRLGHLEGYNEGKWILLDFGDMVAHIFYEETRKFYDLERLWKDAEIMKVGV
jgi:ribosome-associated protein